jgi:hypothetical protein
MQFTAALARATRSAVPLQRKMPGIRPSDAIWAGPWLLGLALFGVYQYLTIVDKLYPIERWLFCKLAMLWGWVLLLSLACTSFGQLLIVRVLRLRGLTALESAVFAMASGVLCFELAMYVGGALAWYNPVFAVALPGSMLALGWKDGYQLGRSLLTAASFSRRTPLSFVMVALGSVCVGLLYLGALTPDSLNYDSTWCHLTVAQDYARAGRIVPFPADYTKNMPQLASLIHTWGYLVPGLDTPLRWMLVLQNEFGLFLWTLAGCAAGIRRLVNDQGVSGSWASFFLFPIIFVYDNNMGGAADHVCAFFSVPMLLATLRLCRTFRRADGVLLGMMCAGGLATKYQAAYLIVGVVLVVSAAWLHALWWLRRQGAERARLLEVGTAPLVAAVALLVCVCPHFIRQAVFHHNPLYPFLQDVIPSVPTHPNAALLFNNTISDPHWIPSGGPWQRFSHATRLFWTFSFEPHYSFTRNMPVFGSLFTLLLPAVFFIRDRWRIAVGAFIASVSLFIWAYVYNVDRNLQVFMPIMVAVTGALIIRSWRSGWLGRIGIAPLVALQVIWGGDALFYNSHNRIDSGMALIRSGFDNTSQALFDGYRKSFRDIHNALPKGSKVLLHNAHPNLGIDHDLYLDGLGYQALITYDRVRTPAQLYHYYRKLGITHLIYDPNGFRAPTKQQEVLWNAFIRSASAKGQFGNYRVLELPREPPAETPPWRVGLLGMRGYVDGIYAIEQLNTDESLPHTLQRYAKPAEVLSPDVKERKKQLEKVQAILIGRMARAEDQHGELLQKRFERNLAVDPFTLYLGK